MQTSIRKDLIKFYVAYLQALFGGIRNPVPHRELRKLHEDRDYRGMLEFIRKDLGLKTRIKVKIVQAKDSTHKAWFEAKPNDIFGIASPRKPVMIQLQRSFLQERDFEAEVVVMAHELSHLMLFAKADPLCVCEEAVELTAMVLGYRKYYSSVYKPRQVGMRERLHLRGLQHPLKYVGIFLDTILRIKVMKVRHGALSAKEVQYAIKFIRARSAHKYQKRARPAR